MDYLDVIKSVREKTDTILLAFSCGKDSIAMWIELKKHFKKIIPYYMFLIPDLEFVENSLKYFETVFQERIIRVPNPSFYRMIKNMVFQPPERCSIIENINIPKVDYTDIQTRIREENKLSPYCYTANGVRQNDSIQRRLSIKKHGAINHKRKQFFPIFDWNKEKIISTIRQSGIKLPIDYKLFGRSFDGIDFAFTEPLKNSFPEDYKKILYWFPLACLESKRREFYGRRIEH